MTDHQRLHPDLLRRFVPTPYIFDRSDGGDRLVVESNDLEIALSVRRSVVVDGQTKRAGGLTCKLIRDLAAPVTGSEMTIFSDGALRVLFQGTGTILIHDRKRSELLGFIARDVKAQELASSLIPALLDT